MAGSSGNTLRIQGSVASPTFSGTVALNNALTVDSVDNSGNQTTTFSGVITGSSTITKGTGPGTVALTGANGSSYNGSTVINGGALSFANGALGNGSASITFGGDSTLRWAAGNTQDISNHPLSSNGFTGTLDVGTNNVTLATANGLTGTGNFTKYFSSLATGTLTLSAANDLTGTYTGSTSGGATILTNANALQNATVAPSNQVTSGIVFDQSVTANGNRFTIGGLTGSGKVALENNALTPAAVALQIGNNNVSSTSTAIGGITGAGSLEKIGSGTFTLNTPGYYTGDTTVTAGTFALGASGVIGNSLNVSVASGAILDVSTPPSFTIGAGRALRGTGTVIGATTVNGVVAPGVGGIGQLNINSTVTWNGAVTNPWQFELGAGSTADKLHLTGDFTKGTGVDGADFVFDFAGSTSTGTFTLVDWTGSSTFVDASFSYVNLGGGHTATFAIVAGSPNQLQVTVSGGGGSPYDTWAASKGLTGLPGSSTDPPRTPTRTRTAATTSVSSPSMAIRSAARTTARSSC